MSQRKKCPGCNRVILSQAGREEIAMALILLRDFKAKGRWDVDMTLYILRLAESQGVLKEYEALIPKVPPMKIEERYP